MDTITDVNTLAGSVAVTHAHLNAAVTKIARLLKGYLTPTITVSSCNGRVSLETSTVETRVSIQVLAESGTNFSETCVPLKAFSSALKSCDKRTPVELQQMDAGITIVSGSSTFAMPFANPDLYGPKLPMMDTGVIIMDGPAGPFRDVVANSITHAGTDHTRPMLSQIKLINTGEQNYAGATDSYRLCQLVLGDMIEFGTSVEIPARELRLATQRLGDAESLIISNHPGNIVRVKSDMETWAIKCDRGQYPNFAQFIPDENTFIAAITVDRKQLMNAALNASRIGGPRSNAPLRYKIGDRELKLTLISPDEATFCEVIPCETHEKVSDDLRTAGIDAGFLHDALKILKEDQVTINYISPYKPMLLTSGDDRVLIMPIILNS
jgi:DNA polymerase III sliding clamp (beta) subunit (PCNA family)